MLPFCEGPDRAKTSLDSHIRGSERDQMTNDDHRMRAVEFDLLVLRWLPALFLATTVITFIKLVLGG